MIGLGLMVDSDTVADYTIVDDPSPVEKTGDLWVPVKDSAHDDLICSADKYAALMPKSSILRHPQAKKTESLDVMSRSPSDTSIYTAVSLATLVMEESMIPASLSEIDDDQKTKLNERLIARGRLDADGKKNQTRLREHESYILDREPFEVFQAICCHSLLPSRFGRIGSCVARARIGRYVLAPRCLASDSTFLCLTIRSFALGDTDP